MENYIYERNYSQSKNTYLDGVEADFPMTAELTEYFRLYNEYMKTLPKIVVEKDKESFERLVPKLDEFVRERKGAIRAIIDYKRWESRIVVSLPFFEFTEPEEAELFIDIAKSASYFNFESAGERRVRLNIGINYFDEMASPEMEELEAEAAALLSQVNRQLKKKYGERSEK